MWCKCFLQRWCCVLFLLRESDPVLDVLSWLKNESRLDFDILLIYGHWALYLGRCGLASYIGYITISSTNGIDKNLIYGSLMADHFIGYCRNVPWYSINKGGNKRVCISAGRKISLAKSVQIIKEITRDMEIMSEPLKLQISIQKITTILFEIIF